jgi:phage-related protein (TIGR01555 family)
MSDKQGLLSRMVQAAMLRADSWVNQLTGLGTARDKRTWTQMELDVLPPEELETLYRASALHSRVVDLLPNECFRAGFEVRIPGEAETAQEANGLLADLQAEHHLAEAYRLGRLYGGGLVRVTVDDGRRPGLPVDKETINRVTALNHFSSREAWAYEYYADMNRKGFGSVAVYFMAPLFTHGMMAMGSDSLLHATRTLRFEGIIGERHINQMNNGWPDSILQRVHETIRDWGSGYGSAAHLLQDASQGVYKLPELTKMLMQNRMDVVIQKIAAIDQAKSVLRAILLSEGESYERKDVTFSGIGDTLMRLDFQLAAVTGIPVTVLLGQAPAGLNATGMADLDLFRATAQSEQRKRIQPQAENLLRLIFRSRRGPTSGTEPEKWSIVWRPLSVPTEKEQADTRKIHAETAQILVDIGVVSGSEVARSMFGGEEYSAEISVDPAALEALPTGTPGEEGTDPEAPAGALGLPSDQPASATALNGAQVTSAKSIVADVAARLLPREAGLGMLMEFFRLTQEQAENIMGEVGRSFFATAPEPAPAQPRAAEPTEEAARGDDAGEHAALLVGEFRSGQRKRKDVVHRLAKLFNISKSSARALLRDMAHNPGRKTLKPTRAEQDRTNFPRAGDNDPVSFKGSSWPTFDPAYARELREKWPEIWARAGNTLGNRHFQRLAPVAERDGVPAGPADEKSLRLREAWAARHHGNKLLPGVVAQVKWLVVGEMGEQSMKELIDKEKARLRAQRGER